MNNAHGDLLGSTRHLGRLIRLRRSSTEGILEVVVDRVIALPLSLRQREDVEVELFALLEKLVSER